MERKVPGGEPSERRKAASPSGRPKRPTSRGPEPSTAPSQPVLAIVGTIVFDVLLMAFCIVLFRVHADEMAAAASAAAVGVAVLAARQLMAIATGGPLDEDSTPGSAGDEPDLPDTADAGPDDGPRPPDAIEGIREALEEPTESGGVGDAVNDSDGGPRDDIRRLIAIPRLPGDEIGRSRREPRMVQPREA